MQQPVKYFHKRLNSTNLYASELLKDLTVKKPFWVRTDDQFAGKGQGANSWVSEPGQNLTGTLVIFPDHFEAFRQFDLSKIFALASVCFLELFIDEIRIKWPNDLYAGDRKIGGILIETAIKGKFVDYAVLGIGLNINQINFPASLPNPVSIKTLTRVNYKLQEMENLFLESFLNQYGLIESAGFNEIDFRYLNKLYRFNEMINFKKDGKILEAKIVGVTENGHLILQTASGSLRSYAYQEVEYVLPA